MAAIPDQFVVVNDTSRAQVADVAERALRCGVRANAEGSVGPSVHGTSTLRPTSDSRRPRVIVFTALSLEYKVVRQHVEGVRTFDRERNWEIGTFGTTAGQEVDVLLIETGPENARAAAVTAAAIENFRPLAAIYTGVAGGLARKGVKPGDVIVPPHIYHYGTGKGDTELGQFGQRPRARSATKRMRFAAQRVDRRDGWRGRLRSGLAEQRPKATLEPMASGDVLVKSTISDVYTLLRLAYEDAVAIDMESGGFLASVDEFPEIEAAVVRGVSDLLDDKNPEADEQRQPRAAAHAAAFTFALLDEVVTSITERAVADDIARSAELELSTVEELANPTP